MGVLTIWDDLLIWKGKWRFCSSFATFTSSCPIKTKLKTVGKLSTVPILNLKTHNEAYSWSQSSLASLTKGSVSWMSSFKELWSKQILWLREKCSELSDHQACLMPWAAREIRSKKRDIVRHLQNKRKIDNRNRDRIKFWRLPIFKWLSKCKCRELATVHSQ